MDKESIQKEAVKSFRSGFNCSQSVLGSLAEIVKTDRSVLEKVAAGFGGGMGHMQGTCGALTGSFMAISLYCGNKYPGNDERTNEAYRLIKKFDSEFKKLHK
ncbi:MAG: C_GCAxxG_C_C family protein, partial [Bacteroidales bacterium]|nr:C_GCAxxG_C_C family protein [Bacteroidales bacterium]